MYFIRELNKVLDRQDKKKVGWLTVLLVISGLLSVMGIGAVLPFMMSLLYPQKVMSFSWFHGLSYHTVVLICVIGLIVAFWIKNIMNYIALLVRARILFGISAKVSKRLFRNTLEASYRWHLGRNTPDLIRDINNETYNFGVNVINALGAVATELISSILVIITLVLISPLFTAVILVALIGFLLAFFKLTQKRNTHYGELRASAWANQVRQVLNGLSSIKEVKVYQREGHYIEHFNRSADETLVASTFSTVNQNSSRMFLEAASVSVVLVIVYLFILTGIPADKMVLLLSVFGVASIQLMPSMNRMMQSYSLMRYYKPTMEIIKAGLISHADKPYGDSEVNLPVEFKNKLCLQNIYFTYADSPAIDNVSIDIMKGQSVAFCGHSGAGKSTLVDVILGLHRPESGEILIDDVRLTNETINNWQRHFGYIPQQIVLFDGTIKENVAIGLNLDEIDEVQVWKVLEIANLADFVKSLPEGLGSFVGENGVRLSGGQRQRIGIARALYNEPDILVMDEATAALDYQTEREVTQAIGRASEHRTLITIAHRISTVRNYDKIFVFDQGKLISSGTYDQLKTDCAIFSQMVHLSTENV